MYRYELHLHTMETSRCGHGLEIVNCCPRHDSRN